MSDKTHELIVITDDLDAAQVRTEMDRTINVSNLPVVVVYNGEEHQRWSLLLHNLFRSLRKQLRQMCVVASEEECREHRLDVYGDHLVECKSVEEALESLGIKAG